MRPEPGATSAGDESESSDQRGAERSPATWPIHKLEVAKHLLRRATIAFFREDYVSALVLGGTAEDLFQGLLKREGRADEASRPTIAREWLESLPQRGSPLDDKHVIRHMRHWFNWVRHADDESEPLVVEMDWVFQSVAVISRAQENYYLLTDRLPWRCDEIQEAVRAAKAAIEARKTQRLGD